MENKILTLQQVFNCDKTGHYWRLIPNETLVSAGEKETKGFKKLKDHVLMQHGLSSLLLFSSIHVNQRIHSVLSTLTRMISQSITMSIKFLDGLNNFHRMAQTEICPTLPKST